MDKRQSNESPKKPPRIEVSPDRIPREIKARDQWVLWKWEERDGELTKPPFDAKSGKYASSTDESTWSSFDVVYSAYQKNGFDGVGFVLTFGLIGIDFDNCRDPSTCKINKDVLAELKKIDSYSEISPSGTGVKVLVNGILPHGGHHSDDIGIFDKKRYFCITGHTVDGVSSNIEPRQKQIEKLIKKLWPRDFQDDTPKKKEQASSSPSIDDVELIAKIRASKQGAKFDRLWSGDWSDYPTQSEGDMALCCILSFWTNNDAGRMDGLFHQSGLHRPKWNQHGYAQRTIEKAISLNTESYNPPRDPEKDKPFETPPPDPEPSPPDEPHKGHHFSLVHVADVLTHEEDTSWIWEGILPTGGMSLIVAKPKVGKTTLAYNLSLAVARGEDFLGLKTTQTKVVYLALEEKKGALQKKLAKRNIDSEVPLYFHFGPAPAEAMKEVVSLIKETGAGLLVIDILQKFCRVRDLNDYAQVTRSLEPLMSAARGQNCHISLVHHAGKSDRQDGDDILGSTGLLGGVDTSIHIKKRDKHRVFFTIQRYGEDIPETVLRLNTDDSLSAVGTREAVEVDEAVPLVQEIVKEGSFTVNDIWEQVPKGHSVVSKAIKKMVEEGRLKRTGSGKKGDPYIYSFFPSYNTNEEGRKEFETHDKPSESHGNFPPENFQEMRDSQEGIRKAFSDEIVDLSDQEIVVEK